MRDGPNQSKANIRRQGLPDREPTHFEDDHNRRERASAATARHRTAAAKPVRSKKPRRYPCKDSLGGTSQQQNPQEGFVSRL